MTTINNSSLHIAFIHKDFPFGGAEKVTWDIANWLCAKGVKVTVLAMYIHQEYYPLERIQRFSIHKLPVGRIKYSTKVANSIKDYIVERKVDVLITCRELLYMPWLKKRTGVRVVYELHSSPFYEFIDIREKKGTRLTLRQIYSCGIERILTLFYKSKYKRVYHWADVYGVLCDCYKHIIEEKLRLGRVNKVWVLPNSVRMPVCITGDKQHTIIFVGRLTHRDKRVDRLLRIWQMAQPRINGWKMKIVGSGPDERYLKQMAIRLLLKDVSFEGQSNDVQRYYDEASILCLTSSFEGWPMVVAEAQANGVIPIMFESFLGAKDMVSTGSEGILVEPFDEKKYADELVRLANDENRMRQMRRTTQEKARQYGIDRSGKAWIEMLDKLEESCKA